MKEMEKNKEIYRLWWEYFKRSRNYSEEQLTVKLSIADFRREWWAGNRTDEVESFFQPPFEEWWEQKKDFMEALEQDKKCTGIAKNIYPPAIRLYREFIEEDIDSCIEVYKRKKGKEPNFQEFKDSLKKWMTKRTLYSKPCIIVNLERETDELIKEFKGFIKKWKKYSLKRGILPKPSSNKVYIKELEGYLRIYDSKEKEGLALREIAKKEFPRKAFDEDIKRKLLLDCNKAKKIIKNVERGIFPGDYQGGGNQNE